MTTVLGAPGSIRPAELTLQQAFSQGEVLTGAGAYGTYKEIAAYGGKAIYSEEGLQTVNGVIGEYLGTDANPQGAGVEVITSYTFGLQHEDLDVLARSTEFNEGQGPQNGWERINEGRKNAFRSAMDAAEARFQRTGRQVLVLAAVRPPGDCYDPAKPCYSYDQRVDIAKKAIRPLVQVGAKNFLFETVPSLEDASAMVDALQQVAKEERVDDIDLRNVAVSLFARTRDYLGKGKITLPDGSSLQDVVRLAKKLGIGSLGFNCVSPTLAVAAARELPRSGWDGYMTFHPNGLYSDPDDSSDIGRLHGDAVQDIDTWLHDVGERLLDADHHHQIRILGGCCVTTADTIYSLDGYTRRHNHSISARAHTVSLQKRGGRR